VLAHARRKFFDAVKLNSVPRHGFSWQRGRSSDALFRGNWRVWYGII
jgi:hypothetical protein